MEVICCWITFGTVDDICSTLTCGQESFVVYIALTSIIELVILKPPSILNVEITVFSFLCSGLLSSVMWRFTMKMGNHSTLRYGQQHMDIL